MTWKKMLTVATQSSAPPYLAVTAGPASHSPPPIAEAPITRPGPIIARMFRQVKTGASISSPVSHRGMALVPGWGASNDAFAGAVGAVDVMERTIHEGRRRQRPMMGVFAFEINRVPKSASGNKKSPASPRKRKGRAQGSSLTGDL